MGVAIPGGGFVEDRASGALVVDGGLRFDSGKSNYLNRTPGSAGNRQTWTWSSWVKRNSFGVNNNIFSGVQDGNNGTVFYFDVNNNLNFLNYVSGGNAGRRITTNVYRDSSSWYHILLIWDSTNATVSNRIRIYVNGAEVTSFGTNTDPSSANSIINSTNSNQIGADVGFNNGYSSLQLSNAYFIDGQALDVSYFGYTDALTNTWRPKKLSSSVAFGTNGFYLPFDGSAPIGQDQSGRGNNWTPVNFGGSNTLEKATGALPILNTDGGGKIARVGVRTDSSASSLVLALPLVGIKSDFSNKINSGTTEKIVTNNNTVTFDFAVSNFYGGSAKFTSASSQYLTVNASSDFDFGTNNWTMEAYVYMNSTSSGMSLTDYSGQSSSTAPYGQWYFGSSGGFMWYHNGTNYAQTTASKVPATKWLHVALVKNSGTLYHYLDGVLQASQAHSETNTGKSDYNFLIGQQGSSSYWNGYIQDFRIYKGLAKYTSNFIPASTDPDILPDTPSGVSYTSNLTQITDGAVAFDGTGDYLTVSKTNAWPTGTQDATIEFFLYRNGSGSSVTLFGKDYSGAGLSCFYLTSSNVLYFYDNNIATTGGNGIGGVSIAQSKWYHIALTRSGSSLRLFLDGQLIDSNLSASGNWYDSGSISYVMIGARENPIGNQSHNGFISNSHVVFDTALYTSNFTPPTGPISSVANTKLLCCKSNSSATAFDVSPGTITANGDAKATNFNPFTVNINTQRGKQSGYCTLNPLKKGAHITSVTNGNLQFESTGSSQYGQIWGTVAVNSGKWYWEGTEISGGGIAYGWGLESANSLTSEPGGDANTWVYLSSGYKYNSGSIVSYGFSSDDGDTIGVAFNADNGELSFYKNGIYMGVAYTLTTGRYYAPVTGDPNSSTNCSGVVNFGQKPFKFPPPAGFQPLALANTPRPTIVRPDQYVGVTTYTGTGAARSINTGFKPDLVWVKKRGSTSDRNIITDSVRGANLTLNSDDTRSEATATEAGQITAFNGNGFSLGTNSNVTGNGDTFVAWSWKAGGNSNTYNINDVGYATASAAGLTAGTITPTGASVNTKSGFSIITYTGNGTSGATVSHGLGITPSLLIVKRRSNTGSTANWPVWHSSLTAGYNLFLNTTDNAQAYSPSRFTSTVPTSTVFSLGSGDETNYSGGTFVAYLWTEIPGFSKFGSYTGNNSTDGPVVITGFKPRWIMMKCTQDVAGDVEQWIIRDGTRNPYNAANANLYANLANAEDDASGFSGSIDILSNGFKLRGTYGAINASATYIYAAFAETPTQNLYGAQANAR